MIFTHMDRRTGIIIRLVGLALISWSVASAPHWAPGGHGRALAVTIALVICVAAGLRWAFASLTDAQMSLDVWALAAAGGFLTAAGSDSAASAFVFVAIVSAGIRAELTRAAVVVGVGALALAIGGLAYDWGALGLLAFGLGFSAALLGASNARQVSARAEQAELLLAQAQRSHEEQLRAARLEESTRIAGDIHDVLAHTLAGLTIQLEATAALMRQGAPPERTAPRVERALDLAREGLSEARRAVGALRGEAAAGAPELEALVEGYQESVPDARAELVWEGDQAQLSGDAGTVVSRVVREALTNIRKHAPGADVRVSVDVGSADSAILAVIENQSARVLVPDASGSGLADSGGGYGIQGMRERAERVGGTLHAGPTASGWRVELRIPRDAG